MHGQLEGWLGHGLAARSSRGSGSRARRCGGALAGGPVVASRRQGLGLEHHDYAADAPGKESGGGAHRGGRGIGGAERRLGAATSSLEGGSAVASASSGTYRGGRGR
jgi:hypothetical protein